MNGYSVTITGDEDFALAECSLTLVSLKLHHEIEARSSNLPLYSGWYTSEIPRHSQETTLEKLSLTTSFLPLIF